MSRRIKIVWGGSQQIKGRWRFGLFGLYDRVEGKRDDGLAISVRGVLIWLLAFAVVAYLAGAAALYYWWQRNPYSILGFQDALLFPVRRSAVSEKKGQAFIAQGTDLFRARKYNDAATLLRLGLSAHPHDYSARLLLARYYLLANQRPLALRVLQDGVTTEYPGRAYLETMFRAEEEGEDFNAVVKVCEQYAARLRTNDARLDYRWLIGRQFADLEAAGRHADALALALAEEPGELANEHRVLALLALGRATEALAVLDDWRGRPGAPLSTIVRLRVRCLREAKQIAAMGPTIAELRAFAPADPAPAVYGIVQLAMAGDDTAADALLQDYFFRFAGSAENLRLLAEPLAEIGDLARVQQCLATAAEHGHPLIRLNVLLVQLYVQRGEWANAAGRLAKIPSGVGRDAFQVETWRSWMRQLIEVAQGPTESAQLGLVNFLRDRPWPLPMFRRTIEALVMAKRFDAAHDIIAVATREFPVNPWLQEQNAKVAAAMAAREAGIPVAVAVTKRLPAEKAFFEQLDETIAARKWDDALQLIRDARGARPAPAWVALREPSLRLAQVRIGEGNGDRAEMLAAARAFLNGSNERAQQTLEAAQEFFRAGDQNAAIALAREVLGRTPNFAPAQRLLAQWEPKSAAKK